MDPKDLRALLQKISKKDLASFEALYHEYKTPVFTILLRITQSRTLSEDLLQEFFLKLYNNPPTQAKNPRAYLFQMARNLALDALRREKPTADLPFEPAAADLSDRRIDLQLAFGALDEIDRQIVSLHLYGGLRFREIAGICAMPLGTVLWRYRRAIQRLRELLNGGTI